MSLVALPVMANYQLIVTYMKDAKEFYEIYDISHPKKLLPREELLFEKLESTRQDYEIRINNQNEEITELKNKDREIDIKRLSLIGTLAGFTIGVIFSIGWQVADSQKRALHRENELLRKENIYLRNTDKGKLAIENEQLKEKIKQQQSELQEYSCFWKACIK